MKRLNQRWPLLLGIAWLAALAVGFRLLGRYEATPGRPGAASLVWPSDSALALAADGDTLVMLAHPRCSCTRASIDELAHLMTRFPGRFQAHVLFFQPTDRPDSWAETASWREAAAIPGVRIWRDRGDREARLFGAQTSGQVYLYDARGRRVFSGGITGLRGHIGDNAGRRALTALLAGETPASASTPVFGCALAGPDSAGARTHAGSDQND